MKSEKIAEWAEKYCGIEIWYDTTASQWWLRPARINIDPGKWFLTGDNDMRLAYGWVAANKGMVYINFNGKYHGVSMVEGDGVDTPQVYYDALNCDTRQQAVYDALEKALS